MQVAGPNVPIWRLSAAIATTLRTFGVRPMRNLCGHHVGRWTVHCPPAVPNLPEDAEGRLVPGAALAIEPFATDGPGRVAETGVAEVFRLLPDHDPGPTIVGELREALLARRGLPFSRRDLARGRGPRWKRPSAPFPRWARSAPTRPWWKPRDGGWPRRSTRSSSPPRVSKSSLDNGPRRPAWPTLGLSDPPPKGLARPMLLCPRGLCHSRDPGPPFAPFRPTRMRLGVWRLGLLHFAALAGAGLLPTAPRRRSLVDRPRSASLPRRRETSTPARLHLSPCPGGPDPRLLPSRGHTRLVLRGDEAQRELPRRRAAQTPADAQTRRLLPERDGSVLGGIQDGRAQRHSWYAARATAARAWRPSCPMPRSSRLRPVPGQPPCRRDSE